MRFRQAFLFLAVTLLASCFIGEADGQPYTWPSPPSQYYYPPYYAPQPQQQPRRKSRPRPAPEAEGDADGSASQGQSSAPVPFEGSVTTIVWGDSDSLERIASASGTTPARILNANRLRRSELREGQALTVPAPAEGSGSLPAALKPEAQTSREVWRGVRGKKRIALTFDAGSDDEGFETLLSNLQGQQVAATFFMTGEFQKKFPQVIQRIDEAGYRIHNHTWSHPEFTKITGEAMINELERTDKAIEAVTGESTKPYWRPPFGDRDQRVLRTTAQAGYQSIYWTIDSLDSFGEPKSSSFIVNRVLNPSGSGGDADRYLDGAIVLMHIGTHGTPQSIPEIVSDLRARGFTFVTVDEILNR